MLLAIDAGNTNICFALFQDDTMVGCWRTATDIKKTHDDWGVWLYQVLSLSTICHRDIKQAIIASVVPSLDYTLKTLCDTYFHIKPVFIDAKTIPLTMVLNSLEEVGADRMVNAFAAKTLYQAPMMVVDFGTATTIDVVRQDGAYIGGIIAPGIQLSLEALYQATARLPKVAIVRPPKTLGTSTVSAMQSGLYWGYVGMVEGLLNRLQHECFMDKKVCVISTGGLGGLFAPSIPMITLHDGDITLKGLMLLAARDKNA
jgi:type III pantothenate kinase